MLDFLIQNEIDRVAAFLLLDEVRHLAECNDVGCVVQCQSVFERKALTVLDFFPDGSKLFIAKIDNHKKFSLIQKKTFSSPTSYTIYYSTRTPHDGNRATSFRRWKEKRRMLDCFRRLR